MTVSNSTLSGNSAFLEGGGIYSYSYSDGPLTVSNSTLSGNSAYWNGGGIYSDGPLTVSNSTLSGNLSRYGDGGGLKNYGTLTLRNSILANNTTGGDCSNSGTVAAGSTNNLIKATGTNACGLINGTNGNLIGIDPLLGTLADNGGSTQTFALLAGSPAIDAGNDATCLTTDQNGTPRPQGAHCDMGAYESYTLLPIAPSNLTATAASPTQINLSWTDNSSNETGFKIFRNAVELTPSPKVSATTGTGTTVSFSDTGLTCGTTYNYTVKATNAVGDSTAVAGSFTTQACPLPQTITSITPTSATYGDGPLTLSATGGASSNPVMFNSTTTGVCTTSGTNGSTLTIVSTGTCTVTANQAGNANYNAAATVTQNITINATPVTPPSVTTLPVVTPPVVTPPPVTSTPSTPPLPNQSTLFLQVDGTGHGKVTTDTGLSCHSTDCQTNEVGELKCNSQACTQREETGSYVTLTPQADSGAVFSNWGGHEDCVDGKMFMNGNKLCIAFFRRIYELTVTLQGPGQVMGYGANQQPVIDCGSKCQTSVSDGMRISLQATPSQGMTFGGWSGDCGSSTQNPLTLEVSKEMTCQATFVVPVPAKSEDLDSSAKSEELDSSLVVSTPPAVATTLPTDTVTPVTVPPVETTPSTDTTTPVTVSPVETIPPTDTATLPVVTLPPSVATTLPTDTATSAVVTVSLPVATTTPVPEPVMPPVAVTVTPPPVVTLLPVLITGVNYSCALTGDIDEVCNYSGQEVTDLNIQETGIISNGVLNTTIVNHGWVSNFHITATGKLSGGVVTGYIKNDGLMLDFDFKGMSILGGTLGGVITNTSKVGGYFQDVTLLPNTKITGGSLSGIIKGDKNASALLENVRVKSRSKLSGVKLGKGVKLEKGVVVEDKQ